MDNEETGLGAEIWENLCECLKIFAITLLIMGTVAFAAFLALRAWT